MNPDQEKQDCSSIRTFGSTNHRAKVCTYKNLTTKTLANFGLNNLISLHDASSVETIDTNILFR